MNSSNLLTLIFTILGLISKYGPSVVEAIAKQWEDEGKEVTPEDILALKESDDMETIKAILGAKAHLLENASTEANASGQG